MWGLKFEEGNVVGSPKRVETQLGNIQPLRFINDHFYYYISSRDTSIYTANFNPKNNAITKPPMRIKHHLNKFNFKPVWSPDNKKLAYCSTDNFKTYKIMIRSLETGKEHSTWQGNNRVTPTRWSRDAKSLLVSSVKRSPHVFEIESALIDIEKGTSKTIIQYSTGTMINTHDLSVDDQEIYYNLLSGESVPSQLRDDKWGGGKEPSFSAIVARNIKTGKDRELLQLDPQCIIEGISRSPDGKKLALIINDSKSKTLPSRLCLPQVENHKP